MVLHHIIEQSKMAEEKNNEILYTSNTKNRHESLWFYITLCNQDGRQKKQ